MTEIEKLKELLKRWETHMQQQMAAADCFDVKADFEEGRQAGIVEFEIEQLFQNLQQERDSYKKKLEEVKQILDGNESKYAQEAVRVCNEVLKEKTNA